eukprot:scaffold43478_cov19-Tisochrysis_lutea.AAC.2
MPFKGPDGSCACIVAATSSSRNPSFSSSNIGSSSKQQPQRLLQQQWKTFKLTADTLVACRTWMVYLRAQHFGSLGLQAMHWAKETGSGTCA